MRARLVGRYKQETARLVSRYKETARLVSRYKKETARLVRRYKKETAKFPQFLSLWTPTVWNEFAVLCAFKSNLRNPLFFHVYRKSAVGSSVSRLFFCV